ncbi:MAG: efflux RND transporter periplasmic adaptor subunit [Bacteroidetes bacterium]|nr:efflux RND transporter periplasmic adaptor subunit [Bacteroidota bacterium]
MKKTIWIVVVIGVLAAIKLLFISPNDENEKKSSGKQGFHQENSVTVYIVKPQQLSNNVSATGTLIANEEAILTPEISGKVVFLNMKEGKKVSKGELLVKINDTEYRAQLSKIELQIKINEEKLNRQKQLLSIKGISQEDFDITLNMYNSSKADLEFINAQIAKTEIRAPFSGIIGLRYISEGSYVSPTSRIASIQQLNPIKIDFSIPEKYVEIVKVGDIIQFNVEGSNIKHNARVYAIEPKVDLNTRTLQLRAIAENNNNLLPGSFAKIDLPLAKIENALMIPTEAIIPVLKGKTVFAYRNGKAEQIKVETGIRTDTKIQIVSGLQIGDSIITTGIMQLRNGSPVKVISIDKNNK